MKRLFLFFLFFILPVAYAQYTIIVDAGSSGSRLYLYEYNQQNHTSFTPQILQETKAAPGLSSVAIEDLDHYLNQLFTPKVLHTLSRQNQLNTPVYFYGTAGMRMTAYRQQQQYYMKIKTWLREHTAFQSIVAKTITGEQEGMYAWLALSHSLKTLNVGLLELGGASTQLVFPMNKNLNARMHEHLYPGSLFSNSFLGLGADAASAQFMNKSACFNPDYPLPNGLTGDGNFDQCVQAVSQLLFIHSRLPMSISDEPQRLEWYGVSGFYYTAKALELPDTFTLYQLKLAGKKMCRTPWHSVKINDKYSFRYCFNASYQFALLHQGYQLPESFQFTAIHQHNGQEISWPLGVLLLHARHPAT
jgi:Golgi nucleoside diphosphatase